MNILITSAGRRVSLVRAFQNELKNLYPSARVFTTDSCPELSAACQVADDFFRVVPIRDANYIQALISICVANEVKMVIPTIDTELLLLSKHKDEFAEKGITVIVSSFALVNICRDKRKTNQLFNAHGISTPADMNKDNLQYPFFIKPFDGSLSADTCVVRSETDLKKEHLDNDRFLFMEYYSPEEYDEYTVDMYYDHTHHVKCIVPRKRLLIRAGEVNKGITSKNGILSHLKNKLDYIEGAVGCLTAQFFLQKSGERIIGIEINARFGGGYPLSYRAGANYPLWLIQEYFDDRQIDYTEDWEDNLLMLRYDDEIIVSGAKH